MDNINNENDGVGEPTVDHEGFHSINVGDIMNDGVGEPTEEHGGVDDINVGDSASQHGYHLHQLFHARSTTSSVKSSTSSAHIKAKAEKAALEAEAKAMEEENALELETLQVQIKTQHRHLKLEQRRREIELKVKYARADALARTYAEAAEANSEVCFKINPTPQPTPKRPLEHEHTPLQSPQPSYVPTPFTIPTPAAAPSNQLQPDTGYLLHELIRDTRVHQQSLVEALQLPKAELTTFDGDPLKYWTFIREFQNTVARETVSDGAKLTRLLQYCTGRAKQLLRCCTVKEPSEGYTLALRLLKERYGDEHTISQSWIDKVTMRPNVTDNQSLQDLADDLRCCRETLDTMGYLNELNNRSNLLLIVDKLPYHLKTRWLREVHKIKSTKSRPPNIDDVTQFVTTAAEEVRDPVFGKIIQRGSTRGDTKPKVNKSCDRRTNFGVQTTSAVTNPIDKPKPKPTSLPLDPCPSCGQNHHLNQCNKFKALRVKDRLAFVQGKRLCVNCYKPGHLGCGKKHNKYLHLPRPQNDPRSSGATDNGQSTTGGSSSSSQAQPADNPIIVCNSTGVGAGKIALPIVPVKVRGRGEQQFVKTYALLDTGSTQSFCSEDLTRRLGIYGKEDTIRLTTLDQKEVQVHTSVVHLEVADLDDTHLYSLSDVLTRPQLNVGLDSLAVQEDLSLWPHLSDLPIPDVNIDDVHLLIGQDVPDIMIPSEVRAGSKGEPYATKTALGWTLNGPVTHQKRPKSSSSYFVKPDMDLQRQVERFWRIDDVQTVGSDNETMSVSQTKVLSIWENSLHRDGVNYTMDIPFKERPPHLPNDRLMAEHRLKLLGKRLSKDPSLKEKYTSGIHDLLQKGYAEPVPAEDIDRRDGCVWYLPHHPVINPPKPDKVRIVYDCAARYQGTSLNDTVYQGPDLTNKLIGVLLRFRQERIALMADIEGMFHQVRVSMADRDALRFLWWKGDDIESQPLMYRMTAHLFGGVWSPSCANFTLKRVAQDYHELYDTATIETIDQNFYVDDCLKSVSSEDEATRLVSHLRELLARGGFRLTKWLSNSRAVLKSLPQAECAKAVTSMDLDKELLPSERALGVLWKIETDTFGFDTNLKEKPDTRRGLLSVTSSIYDPLGFVSPIVLKAKMIFQTLCRLKIGWDEPIPSTILEQWKRWLTDLPLIEGMKVPRCVKPVHSEAIVKAQLHHFADASERGYGAVSYLRLTDTDGCNHCSFVMAKAKLAPLKTTTIPRLEMAAAVVSVKLDRMIKLHMQLQFAESIFWSDSMIVLQYLSNEDKQFQTYVANRIAMIQDQSSPNQWRHVDSASNPADDVSRGLTAQQLIDCERWLNGPAFLLKEEDAWPVQPDFKSLQLQEEAEVKKEPLVYATNTNTTPMSDPMDDLIGRYSSWYALKRALAWVLRVKQLLRMRALKLTDTTTLAGKSLSVKELQDAEAAIVRHTQHTAFNEEHLKSIRLQRLSPITSNNGILCVGGRLTNANIPHQAKHPWIMPNKHRVTELIIQQYHHQYGHSGGERILAELRQKYWIVKGRIAVKRVLRHCLECKKKKATPETQVMADLPKDRVTHGAAPFSTVGVDFFGPFMVKRARSELKRYGCLFTCLTTRAIHIEVCQSLETDSFINALQRFISRYGQPAQIRSDNGTNFVGAQRELRRALQDWNQRQIENYLHQREVQWIFNPPAASHMGGVWERQIRTIRSILGSLLHQQLTDDEGLNTLMCIVEGIVNGRPITKLSDDPQDASPLTPNHLLLLRSGQTLPPGHFDAKDLYKRRWRQVQYLADVFWTRWLKEYLPSLQHRQKWLHPQRNLQVGDLVLIRHESTPRSKWPLGLIVATHPGKDGYVRSVRVKTQAGVYVRPTDKICLLEAELTPPTATTDTSQDENDND
ncbi:uncharacterized protein LOC119731982 [Patiria miniata]|uniref:Integrase catalytic domain-containing protein n=1 Tax=Patiria miniata TaxID=46514 RepID=A0A914ABM5_PATMI|nr:uncharacterized protein LOC119731982 [Patiria miniata]